MVRLLRPFVRCCGEERRAFRLRSLKGVPAYHSSDNKIIDQNRVQT